MKLRRHTDWRGVRSLIVILLLLALVGLVPTKQLERWLTEAYHAPPGEMFGPIEWKVR